MKRVWRAFVRGFWQAWLEVPPASARRTVVGELEVTLTCNDDQFQESLDEAIEKMLLRQAVSMTKYSSRES